jgi:short-subunit dehydrogenase
MPAEAIQYDLSMPGAAKSLARELENRQLSIDLLINNAGFGARGEFWKLPLDRQSEMLRLNVAALIELTHHVVPSMIERRRGGVINVSSMTGFQPIPYSALYAASKAFVTSFSMGLREELRPYGIPVVTLCPGGTRTSFVVIGETGRRKFPGGPQAPEEVVEVALRALERGGGLAVPRWVNKLSVVSERLVPHRYLPRLLARFSRS